MGDGFDAFQGLVAVYTSHRESSLDAIGALEHAVGEAEEAASGSRGLVVLATCNRFEVYLDSPGPGVVEALENLIASRGGAPRVAGGSEAAARIMRIAAGLESRIIGEPEILGQVRDAWMHYRGRGATTPLLDSVFHAAVVAGKRVRRETGIARGHTGYPGAAVRLAARLAGGLDGARVLVAGAGKAGRAAVRILCSEYEPGLLVVASRDPGRAREWLDAVCPSAIAAGREEARGYAPFDAAIVAVTDSGGLAWVPGSSRVVVDISNPPAFPGDPRVHGMREVEEEIRWVIEERRRWVPRALEIIEEELSRLEARLRQRRLAPVLRLLEEYADALAREHASMLGGDGAYDVLRGYYRRLLHPLIVSMRRAASASWRLEDMVVSLEEMLRERTRGVPGGEA